MRPGDSGYLREFGVSVKRVTDYDSAGEFMRWLGERRNVLGIDTETTGLRPDFDHIRYIQFGDLSTGWAIPWGDWRGVAIQALKEYDRDFVFHNSKFDTRFIEKDTDIVWPWHRTHDTMAMAHLADPLRLKGLKPLAARLVDPEAIRAQKVMDEGMDENGWNWETVPLDYQWYWVYAAMDPVLTCHVYEHLEPVVTASYAKPYDLEMGTTRVIAKMEANGALVDMEYASRKRVELTNYAQEARQYLQDAYKIKNPGSSQQLIEFFKSEGIVLPAAVTKSGAQSMDKNVLERIKHPMAETVLDIKKAEKLANTYFKNLIELADDENRVHANIWTMGTRTARMTVTNPALQTLPKTDTTVRTAFIPSPGMSLISCDYSQIEARLMAHFSRSPGLLAAFTGEDDFFCTIASGIFGEPITKKDPRRQLTKNTIYGKLYGAGIEKMAETAGVPFVAMSSVVNGFDTSYPEVKKMARDIHTVGRQRLLETGEAFVITPTGRRLASDDGKDYTLVNYLIQSHAAEIFKRALVDLDTELDGTGARMLLPVHDEAVIEVPTEDAPHLAKLIEETMANLTDYLVPITAEAEWSDKNWGDLVS